MRRLQPSDASGVYNVRESGAAGLRVRWRDVAGAWRHAIEVEDSDDVALTGLDADAPPTPAAGQMLRCSRVEGLTVSRLKDTR